MTAAAIGRRVLMTAAVSAIAARARAEEPADGPVVAAAADLSGALPVLVDAFRQRSGKAIRTSLGASGNLVRQIEQGAPFEVFFSADEGFVHRLEKAGLTVGPSSIYAIGHLVLWVPTGGKLAPDGTLADLGRAMADGRLDKLAIANPAVAPYGRAAQASLEHAGLWAAAQPHLVLGESVAQAAQFARSGAAGAAIIPESLAGGVPGQTAPVSDDWHPPLRQSVVALKGAGDTARAFLAFVTGPDGRAILARFGFAAEA